MRPTIGESIPQQTSMYQVIPWEHTKTGDLLKHKEPEVAVRSRPHTQASLPPPPRALGGACLKQQGMVEVTEAGCSGAKPMTQYPLWLHILLS